MLNWNWNKMEKKISSFKRKEKKFVVIDNTYEEIVTALKKDISVFSYNEDEVSQIKTTYLDDEKLSIFKEYLTQREFRFKIRLRNYGCKNIFEDKVWVEIKVKYNRTTYKKRFIMPKDLIPNFLNGKDIYNELKKYNPNVPLLKRTYNLILDLIKIGNLKPVMTTSYDRIAFQNKSKRIRITVDKQIKHTALLHKHREKQLRIIVFESKIMGKKAKWVKKMENKLSLLPQKRFSKYATGINSVYFPERGTYNFYTNFAEIDKIPKSIAKSLQLIKEHFKFSDIDSMEGED